MKRTPLVRVLDLPLCMYAVLYIVQLAIDYQGSQ